MKICVKVKPRAKEEKIKKIDDFNFSLQVKEPPIRGMANAAVIRILADYFGIKTGNIRIISGHKSKNKIIEII
jgi:uncharacterized protein (TIGR00251 family)